MLEWQVALAPKQNLDLESFRDMPARLEAFGSHIGSLMKEAGGKRGHISKIAKTRYLVHASEWVRLKTGSPHDEYLAELIQTIAGPGCDVEKDFSGDAIRKKREHLKKTYPAIYASAVTRARIWCKVPAKQPSRLGSDWDKLIYMCHLFDRLRDHKDYLPVSYGIHAAVLAGWGRLEEALAWHRKAEVLSLDSGNRSGLGYSYLLWAGTTRAQGDRKTEKQKLKQALAIFTELEMPRESDEVKAVLNQPVSGLKGQKLASRRGR